jgi:hypothetical protein
MRLWQTLRTWWPLMWIATHQRILREDRAEMERMWRQRLLAESDLSEKSRGREPWE